ncbi:hypothetical protein BKA82DRAFT_1000880 [Pisolithus tinctorius]|nr:hypothetical protein BKA82DRAFT_1000880 [Pisolithus tinctorius]
MIEWGTVLERIRVRESKMRYQIEKLVRLVRESPNAIPKVRRLRLSDVSIRPFDTWVESPELSS